MELPSKYLEEAIEAFASLPGVGRKTAMRYAIFLLRKGEKNIFEFSQAFEALSKHITFCKICHNISEEDICKICSNPRRDEKTICVVEDLKDVISIEKTQQYKGRYHVLGGLISPMDGIGPSQLHINSLINRIHEEEITEIILALSSTMEGDTTNFYIFRKLENFAGKISIIARGIGVGDDLEYVDEATLGRSINSRIPYQQTGL